MSKYSCRHNPLCCLLYYLAYGEMEVLLRVKNPFLNRYNSERCVYVRVEFVFNEGHVTRLQPICWRWYNNTHPQHRVYATPVGYISSKALCALQSPFDASLLLRGLKTLHVRVERQCDTAQRLAEYLDTHPKILRVHYPGLPSNSHHQLAKRQMRKFGGMVSFEVTGGLQAAKTCVEVSRPSVLMYNVLSSVFVCLFVTDKLGSLTFYPHSDTYSELAWSPECFGA